MVLVQCLTGMEISEFPNISFEHPRGSTFRKYRYRTLAPVQFTNLNFNHRVLLILLLLFFSFTFLSNLFLFLLTFEMRMKSAHSVPNHLFPNCPWSFPKRFNAHGPGYDGLFLPAFAVSNYGHMNKKRPNLKKTDWI